jgi:hypothetical protein
MSENVDVSLQPSPVGSRYHRFYNGLTMENHQSCPELSSLSRQRPNGGGWYMGKLYAGHCLNTIVPVNFFRGSYNPRNYEVQITAVSVIGDTDETVSQILGASH